MELTEKAKLFAEMNKTIPVYKAAWLDKDMKSPKAGPETWVYHRMWLRNGDVITLSEDDMKSLMDNNLSPRWA